MNPRSFSPIAWVGLSLLALGCHAPIHEERYQAPDLVQSLSVKLGSGDVSIFSQGSSRAAASKAAEVVAQVEGDDNHLRQQFSGGIWTLSEECPVRGVCNADLRIWVPEAATLEVQTGSGDIVVVAAANSVRLDTGSGDVAGRGLVSPELLVRTGSGDVELEFAKEPTNTQVKTGSGDVNLQIPGEAYSVVTDTGSGDRRVEGIQVDPAASRSISISTGSGDITVRGY